MFRNWGFLLGEIWIPLLLAVLLGLFCGWLIWGRLARYKSEALSLRDQLNNCQDDLDECRRARAAVPVPVNTSATIPVKEPEPVVTPKPVFETATAPAFKAQPISVSVPPRPLADDFDGDGIVEGTDEGTRPAALSAARGGKADDLKQIKGIGLKMEQLCNKLGFFHFDQIAGWTRDEVAWVDANLEGFKGRVTRDEWVAQAKVLAEGGMTEFAKKVDKGDVTY